MNKELNDERRLSKQFEYEKKLYFDKWLRYHIKDVGTNNPEAMPIDAWLDKMFASATLRTFMTPGGSYICITEEEDHFWIHFAWLSVKTKHEKKDMLQLTKRISDYAHQPLRYAGKINVMSNHSKEIQPGLWELDLHSS